MTSRRSWSLVGVLADHLGRPGDLLGRGVGPELERPGVHAQQRQPVAEDVVHLPGDLLAGPLLGLLGPELGLGLGPDRPVPQRQDELAPVVDEQAPADGRTLDRDPEREQQHRRGPRLRPDEDVGSAASTLSPKKAAVVLGSRWIATVSRASTIAPATTSEKIEKVISTSATPTGQRRRSHSPRQPSAPATRSAVNSQSISGCGVASSRPPMIRSP
jgi:hypothetical protein